MSPPTCSLSPVIPSNVCTVRLTAAAGTNLARASSGVHSLCSPPTGVYNPKAFIHHAASLGQGCPHCRRFSTAASRRSLASVSVPVAGVVLSHPLAVVALVSHYLTNKLVAHKPLFRRRTISKPRDASQRRCLVLHGFSTAYPSPEGRLPMPYCPFRHATNSCELSRSTCMPNPRR
jgi:hypothetical protein